MSFSYVWHFIPRAGGSHSGNLTRLDHSSHSVNNGIQGGKTEQRRVTAAVRIQTRPENDQHQGRVGKDGEKATQLKP